MLSLCLEGRGRLLFEMFCHGTIKGLFVFNISITEYGILRLGSFRWFDGRDVLICIWTN